MLDSKLSWNKMGIDEFDVIWRDIRVEIGQKSIDLFYGYFFLYFVHKVLQLFVVHGDVNHRVYCSTNLLRIFDQLVSQSRLVHKVSSQELGRRKNSAQKVLSGNKIRVNWWQLRCIFLSEPRFNINFKHLIIYFVVYVKVT